jgi:hypothetical protein
MDRIVLFTYKGLNIDFVYYSAGFSLKKKQSLYPSSKKLIEDFILDLLLISKKNTYLFTYALSELLEKLKAANAFVPIGELRYKIFKREGQIYVIKIKFRSRNEKEKKKASYLIIKDLVLFGQSDIEQIKQNPESFLAILELIKKELKVNINTLYRLSIPAVALKIFRTNFPEDGQSKLIPRLNYGADTYIRRGFFGGRTEVFNPIVEELNYYYYVNLLYPFIMKTKALLPRLSPASCR